MDAVFRSKVDGGFVWVAMAMPGLAFVAFFTAPHGTRLVWLPVSMLFLAAIVVCWTFVATYYELKDDQLVAHCGPFTWHIPLAEVSAIHESSSARSGPALSLDRLEVIYGGGKVLVISPADKARFLATVQRRMAALRSGPAGPEPER
jgi:hypothetical protein